MNRSLGPLLGRLDGWLGSMRQPGGYGGPVAHWWQNRYRYAGPGVDWRYEGLLIGYATLYRKTGDPLWRLRLEAAASDVMRAQRPDGSYPASRFEINPASLGTPHEAAASLGLLRALPLLDEPDSARRAAGRNLDGLIARLWDGDGFNDRPGVPGRVPNKLATLAQALMSYAEVADGDGESYLRYARRALDDVLRYQVGDGRHAGAVHQYAPGAGAGDGRFFPYYAARCVPPLVQGARVFGDDRYRAGAEAVLAFLERSRDPDGSWPQVVYRSGGRAAWPRWIAGSADLLLAYLELGRRPPAAALDRLLAGQSPSGGFATADGFGSQIRQRPRRGAPCFRDVTPVVGWNDKAFRLLCELLPSGAEVAPVAPAAVDRPVSVWGRPGRFREDAKEMAITRLGRVVYRWDKCQPWASVALAGVDVR